ncbi:hypothetical protein RJ640_011604 [Escallonia rubra]|uniref:sucrose-phosphate synthase n=1 Tax=Escallonia rubra TaxID=112253 RepID=A0AA88RZ59_9ASTE|nr:hypothetical protein RJ640_011604 [Escallonia rubra]
MAGNDWINSYLEAILDVRLPIDDPNSSLLLRERGRFSPTRYFVEEVITGFDETDLHRSWARVRPLDLQTSLSTAFAFIILQKVEADKIAKEGVCVGINDLQMAKNMKCMQASSIRNSQERNTRLENMCWRIWNLARQKKQLEGEEEQRTRKKRFERERGRREVIADMSEDLSEGESAHGDSTRGRMPRIISVDAMESWASQHKEKKIYIVLIRHEAEYDDCMVALSSLTICFLCSLHGLIRGEGMELGRDSDTGGQVKYVVELARALGAMAGVYRVDIPTRQISAPEISKVLGEQIGGGQPVWPVAIHGHYADAGNSAALLSGALNVPMLFTGHSLGRDKLEQLLKQGRQSREEIDGAYKIMWCIEAEEISLDASEVIITSTRQEIEEQWHLYDGFDPILERKLRARIKCNVSCYGRFMPRMAVVPSGMEFHHIVPLDGDMDGEAEGNEDTPATSSPDLPIWSEIMHFFTNPCKPMILALARADPKKNITTLVKAFGECRSLMELANLTLIMGNRDAIDDLSSTNAYVLLSIFKLIDKYDLYGHVAYPKHHKQSEVPEIYRLAAKTNGVFINRAFIEPFGLTLIEAAAYGLPIVATKNGGPVDIHRVLDNGMLVDPDDQQSIADALMKLVDISLNLNISLDGEKNDGSDTLGNALEAEESGADGNSQLKSTAPALCEGGTLENAVRGVDAGNFPALRRRKSIFVIAVDCEMTSDILDTIKTIFEAVGMDMTGGSVGFILSTASTITKINYVMESGGLSAIEFDAFIYNSGSKLYYPSSGEECLGLPFVIPPVKELRRLMRIQALRCHAICCQNGSKLNVIPVLASRSQALRYLYVRWGINLSNFVVFVGECGDTDYEGLLGGAHKTVVLKGVCNDARKLHTSRGYPLEDVVQFDNSNIVESEGCNRDAISAALTKLGLTSS